MIIVNKEMYKKSRTCECCEKKSKLVLPLDYMLRFQPNILKKIKQTTNYKKLCWGCVNEVSK